MRFVLPLAMLLLATPALAQVPVTAHPDQRSLLDSADPQVAANKRLVYDFWREVFVARQMDRAADYMAEEYIQHNPNVPTGRQAFVDFFSQGEPQPVRDEIEGLVAILGDHDYVSLFFVRENTGSDGEPYTTTWFDMFRIEDGKIAEHWDPATR